jgi:hypothetical protein
MTSTQFASAQGRQVVKKVLRVCMKSSFGCATIIITVLLTSEMSED